MSRDVRKTRSYARGVVTLIFFVLAVQVAIFTIKSYENTKTVVLQGESVSGALSPESDKAGKPEVSETANPVKNGSDYQPKRRKEAYVPTNPEEIREEQKPEERAHSEAYVPIDLKTLSSRAKLELNSADSSDLVSLPGIGPFFASKILDYRRRLGGFAFKEQLMEVYGIDRERFSVFGDRVWADTTLISRINLSEATQDELSENPYIGSYAARAIIKFREIEGSGAATLAALVANRIIKAELVKILKYYFE